MSDQGKSQAEVYRKVESEMQAFKEALPRLMKTLSGRWVVFLDGQVQSDHITQDEAYRAALERYGLGAGYVIACVEPIEAKPITARALFGIA